MENELPGFQLGTGGSSVATAHALRAQAASFIPPAARALPDNPSAVQNHSTTFFALHPSPREGKTDQRQRTKALGAETSTQPQQQLRSAVIEAAVINLGSTTQILKVTRLTKHSTPSKMCIAFRICLSQNAQELPLNAHSPSPDSCFSSAAALLLLTSCAAARGDSGCCGIMPCSRCSRSTFFWWRRPL